MEGLGFKVDAAADSANHLVDQWYGPGSSLGEDALAVPKWLSPAWCNPPYGKGIEAWLDKFVEQAELGNQVVALLPARVETQWWRKYVVDSKADILFLIGRVPFGRPCSACSGTATVHGWVLTNDEGTQTSPYASGPCPKCDAEGITFRGTQPDHASALIMYFPGMSGIVTWIDWRKPATQAADL